MFFERYEMLCKQRGMTVSAVADEIGINRSSVSQWKAFPERIPSGSLLVRIADYFDVTVDFLLGRTQLEPAEEARNEVRVYSKDGSVKKRILSDDRLELVEKMLEALPEEDEYFYKPKS